MGDGRAGDGALGGVAVTSRGWVWAPVLLLSLGGCQFAGNLVAAGAGGASAAATANPAVGVAVGVGVNAGIDATFAWVARVRQGAEQNAILTDVGTMQPGEREAWKINHDIPIGDEHGEVEVTRLIPNALTVCKGVAFSVETGKPPKVTRHWYTTFACLDGNRWKWALPEPATERWGSLQ